MMDTPICDFVKGYAESKAVRLHMPGHKGDGFLGVEAFDITEVDGADVLYCGDGIIKESQKNASRLFGTARTLYSTEGSSLSIRAMLYLACVFAKENGKALKIAAGRNAHKTFLTAAALLDFEIDWLYGESLISCEITPESLDGYLSSVCEKPVAVYVTSPDYLGKTADVEGLSEVCKRHGVLLLVDNAHGAYLKFLKDDRHPITLGADMCCDSAHKTLPVLTGGGYLHISKTAPKILKELSEEAMQLFASTSPSYLTLQSLDYCNRYIVDSFCDELNAFVKVIDELKSVLTDKGFTLVGDEPLKVTIATKSYGYKGFEVAEILKAESIVCEFCDPDYICFMPSVQNKLSEIEALKTALCALERRPADTLKAPSTVKAERGCSPREALMSVSKVLPVDACEGKIFASVSVSCPPAIPIVVAGEIIDREAIERMQYYGVKEIRVKI